MKPRFILEQKITPLVNRYAIYETDANGNKTNLVAFAQQKRLAFKEKISFFTDESRNQVLFTLSAEKVIDVHGRYVVESSDGKLLGIFKKNFAKSMINSSWSILDQNGQPQIILSESNQVLAIFRRYAGFIPIIGGVIDLVTAFLRYHFVLTNAHTNTEAGSYRKITLFRDHYELSLTDEAFNAIDSKVYMALAVALDALQSR